MLSPHESLTRMCTTLGSLFITAVGLVILVVVIAREENGFKKLKDRIKRSGYRFP